MKKVILLILITLSTFYSFSQCKFKKDEVDEFTKNRIRETKDFMVAGVFSQSYMVQLRQVNDGYFLKLGYSTLGTSSIVIGQGDELMIKLNNDSVITLQSLEIASATHSYSSGMTATTIYCNYSITKEQLELLAKNPAVKIRFYTTDGYLEKETTTNGIDRLLSFANCIIK